MSFENPAPTLQNKVMATVVTPTNKGHENNFESIQTQNWSINLAKLVRGAQFYDYSLRS